jgi:predicted nucleotidyltransferase
MKTKFGDEFIGITIFGSTHKGYFQQESDLDCHIITRNQMVFEYFKNITKSIGLNIDIANFLKIEVMVDKSDNIQDNPEILFYGLFFGDHKTLAEIQKNTLENISEEQWDRIRKIIFQNETAIYKAAERFDIAKKNEEEIKIVSALLRVPPPLKETKEIVRRRNK